MTKLKFPTVQITLSTNCTGKARDRQTDGRTDGRTGRIPLEHLPVIESKVYEHREEGFVCYYFLQIKEIELLPKS